MNTDREVSTHYSRGVLLSRLNAALTEDGVDPDHPSIETLAPYDQFHGRGLEATSEIAAVMQAGPADHILDIGSCPTRGEVCVANLVFAVEEIFNSLGKTS